MPKTSGHIARALASKSIDCSFLLTHLIRQNDKKSDLKAREILEKILGLHGSTKGKRMLEASPQGWYASSKTADVWTFNTEIDDLVSGLKNVAAVSFTESTLVGLKAHRDIFNCKYGLAFDRDWLFTMGANPCLNIGEAIFKKDMIWKSNKFPRKLYNFVPEPLFPYVNVIKESFDATHEREWRYVGDLKFQYSDIKFVFCPEKDFQIFSRVQTAAQPVIFDLAWLDRV